MGARIDGFELEILWQRLIAIMDEADTIIVKTTFSTILRESRDFACILAGPSGLSLCQSQLSTANFSAVFPLTAAI
jgi:N-methylhydantoinase B